MWPPADRLRAHDSAGLRLWEQFPAVDPWVPDLRGHGWRRGLWDLVGALVSAAGRLAPDLPAPKGVTGLDRAAWAIGGTPGHLDRLVDLESGLPVQANDLGALFALTGVDRVGLENQIAAAPLSTMLTDAGLAMRQQTAQAEAGTAPPTPGWVRATANALNVRQDQVEAALLAGAVAWAPGATRGCGLDISQQALVAPGTATLWSRRLLTPGLDVPSEWVVAQGGASLAELASVMDMYTGGDMPGVSEHWEWRIPATGLVMTPATVARGTLVLGCLDLQAWPYPDPIGLAGPWAVGDSTRIVAADVICGQGSALLVDRRTQPRPSPAALFTLHAVVADDVAEADRFARALQGATAGKVWPAAGIAPESVRGAPVPR